MLSQTPKIFCMKHWHVNYKAKHLIYGIWAIISIALSFLPYFLLNLASPCFINDEKRINAKACAFSHLGLDK